MIIYGTRATKLIAELVPDKCPNCQTSMSLQMGVVQRYAHIFWIPSFPVGKTGASYCGHCKQSLTPKEMPPNLLATYNDLKSRTKTPVWTFVGLALFAGLVAYTVHATRESEAKDKLWVAAPVEGDVYSIKAGSSQYTLYKVAAIHGDTVSLVYSLYETNKMSGLLSLASREYDTELHDVTKADLMTMLKDGVIKDVDRSMKESR
ncbi:hypothetical protein ACWKWU_22375 [Chitinophaga lutea]